MNSSIQSAFPTFDQSRIGVNQKALIFIFTFFCSLLFFIIFAQRFLRTLGSTVCAKSFMRLSLSICSFLGTDSRREFQMMCSIYFTVTSVKHNWSCKIFADSFGNCDINYCIFLNDHATKYVSVWMS